MLKDKHIIQCMINDRSYKLEVEANETLAFILREKIGLTGTKVSCEQGECGACTVLLNGKAVNSCLILAPEIEGCEITTIEGISQNGILDPIQEAFIKAGAVQCGFCTPGMVMSTKALLMENPNPMEEEIKHALSGNFCRCTGYHGILKAVKIAAEMVREQKECHNGE